MYLVRGCTVPKALSYSVMGVVGLVMGYYLELPQILGNSIKFASAIQILGGLVCATYQAAQPVEDAGAGFVSSLLRSGCWSCNPPPPTGTCPRTSTNTIYSTYSYSYSESESSLDPGRFLGLSSEHFLRGSCC